MRPTLHCVIWAGGTFGFFFTSRRSPRSTLFPYTTLFRSALATSEASESGARAQIAALGVRLGETRIVSPLTGVVAGRRLDPGDRKSTRLNSSHANISYAVFCSKKKKSPRRHTIQDGK